MYLSDLLDGPKTAATGNCKNGTYVEVEDCCTKDDPCDVEEGDCDSDDECKEGLICGQANCDETKFGKNQRTDCCQNQMGNIFVLCSKKYKNY